jgi:hypothetical protein
MKIANLEKSEALAVARAYLLLHMAAELGRQSTFCLHAASKIFGKSMK